MMLLSPFEERLSSVPRWTIVRTLQKQSVAEHSYRVALIAARLVPHFFTPPFVNEARSRVMACALLHDQAEAFTGDIPTPAGRLISKNHLEAQFEDRFVEQTKYNDNIKMVVKVADYVEALIFLQVEMSMGNKSVMDVYTDVRMNLTKYLIRINKAGVINDISETLDAYHEQQQDPLNDPDA